MINEKPLPKYDRELLTQGHLSIVSIIKRFSRIRIILLAVILLFSVIATMQKPDFLLTRFGENKDGMIQVMTRIWITASLLTTLAVSFLMYIDILRKISRDNRVIKDEGRLERVENCQKKCGIIIVLVFLLISLVGFLVININSDLKVINLLSGVVLVLLILLLDIQLSTISEEMLTEIESQSQFGGQISEETLNLWRDRFLSDRDVVTKLDIPILIGVILTWSIGYLILPSVLNETAMIYAHGFATGSTALQLVIGNISFGFIEASSSI